MFDKIWHKGLWHAARISSTKEGVICDTVKELNHCSAAQHHKRTSIYQMETKKVMVNTNDGKTVAEKIAPNFLPGT